MNLQNENQLKYFILTYQFTIITRKIYPFTSLNIIINTTDVLLSFAHARKFRCIQNNKSYILPSTYSIQDYTKALLKVVHVQVLGMFTLLAPLLKMY